MTRIRAMVSAHYKFDTSKETKELAAALLADDSFTCQDYRKIPSQYIVTDLNVARIFFIARKAFPCCGHSAGNNGRVFL